MATKKKVARSKPLTVIQYEAQGADGKNVARVINRDGECLAVISGKTTKVRRLATVFARAWSTEHVRTKPEVQRLTERLRTLRQRSVEVAAVALDAATRRQGGAS